MATRTSTDPWVRLARITAATGLISYVLWMIIVCVRLLRWSPAEAYAVPDPATAP